MWKSISKGLAVLEDVIVFALMTAASAVLLINIVLRYFFHGGLSWGEQFITYSMIWVSFVGASICVRQGSHVAMRLIIDAVKAPRSRKVYETLLTLIPVAFCVVGFIFGARQVSFLAATGQTASALMIPMWVPYLSLPVGFGLMTIRFLEQLWRVATAVSPAEGGQP